MIFILNILFCIIHTNLPCILKCTNAHLLIQSRGNNFPYEIQKSILQPEVKKSSMLLEKLLKYYDILF